MLLGVINDFSGISSFLRQRALFCFLLYILCLLASIIYISQIKNANRKGKVTDKQLKNETQNVKKFLSFLTILTLILEALLVIVER